MVQCLHLKITCHCPALRVWLTDLLRGVRCFGFCNAALKFSLHVCVCVWLIYTDKYKSASHYWWGLTILWVAGTDPAVVSFSRSLCLPLKQSLHCLTFKVELDGQNRCKSSSPHSSMNDSKTFFFFFESTKLPAATVLRSFDYTLPDHLSYLSTAPASLIFSPHTNIGLLSYLFSFQGLFLSLPLSLFLEGLIRSSLSVHYNFLSSSVFIC